MSWVSWVGAFECSHHSFKGTLRIGGFRRRTFNVYVGYCVDGDRDQVISILVTEAQHVVTRVLRIFIEADRFRLVDREAAESGPDDRCPDVNVRHPHFDLFTHWMGGRILQIAHVSSRIGRFGSASVFTLLQQ